MVDGAALVLDATDRLLGDLADAVPALRAVGDALAALAGGLGVHKVIVAVDDATLGRQVFCSGRVPLGDDGIGLRGPAGAWTQPPSELDADATRLLVLAVGVGVVRATTRGSTGAAATGGISATPAGEAHADATMSSTRATGLDQPVEAAVARTNGLTDLVTEATARAVRHGWGFTLVLVRGDAGLAGALRPRLRAADTLITVSDHELALLLPETAGDRVPYVLARLAQASGAPPFSYGLACCPADGRDPAVLCRTASERLEEAWRAAAVPDESPDSGPGG
jgi:hypothetical protein